MTGLGPVVLAAALAQPVPAPEYVAPVLEQWRSQLGVKVRVKTKRCGYDNAWYTPATDTVTLCTDLFDRPALTRHILAHELAHALFDQRRIPTYDEEFQADELAFWMESDEDTQAAITWHLSEAGPDYPTRPGQHPSRIDRAVHLMCLADGIEQFPVSQTCEAHARSSRAGWLTLLVLTD